MLRILTFCGKPAGFLGSSECYIVVTVPLERQNDAALVSGSHLATCFFLDSQCTTAGF